MALGYCTVSKEMLGAMLMLISGTPAMKKKGYIVHGQTGHLV